MKDGLYEFPKTQSTTEIFRTEAMKDALVKNDVFFVSSKSSNVSDSIKHMWHVRLGHPSDRILAQVLKEFNVKFNSNETSFL